MNNQPRVFNHRRFLNVFIIVLFGFLYLAASWLCGQQMDMLKSAIDEKAQHDLDTMTDMSLEALLKSDYVAVRTFVERWGEELKEYQTVQFIAANGFILAEHANPARGTSRTFSLSKDVVIRNTTLATVRLTGDYHEAELVAAYLRNRLLLGAFLITSVLGVALWFVMNKLALEPLEFMVEKRTRDLAATNIALSQEIDERKALQNELTQREERISLILDSMAEGIYGVDLHGKCTFCNPAALRLLGYGQQAELLGKHIHSLIHHTHPNGTPYAPNKCKVYLCCQEGGGCHADDEIFWRADGTSFPVEYWAQPIIKDGVRVGSVTAFIDITRRKESEAALHQSARDWQETFDSASEAIWILDAEQRVLRSNKAAAQTFQRPLSEIIGRHCWEIAHQTAGPIAGCPACLVRESQHRESLDLQIGDRWFQVTVDPILGDDGQCHRYVHTVTDITERLRIEEQLRQGQKMEAIGTLAGGIAHDFNNILSVIMGYSQLAMMSRADPEKVRQHLVEAGKGAERARQLVQQILTFSRKTEHRRQPLQISLVLKEALKMLRASIPATIEIKQQVLSNGMAEADPTQIHQVIMNLCTNAYHAMRETGGTLTVALDEVELGMKEEGGGVADLPAGRYLELTVSDTGSGIEPQILDKIFEPYFTTKGQGEGTGLGLAVVHGIVRSYHGQVTVRSKIGEGTSFHVYLPMTDRESVPLPDAVEPPPVTGHGERILFVDDEELLCSLAASIFPEHGYQVSTFTRPLAALEAFAKEPDQFDLVVTDMTMPQITGAEFSRKVLAIRGDIPIILCTGYSSLMDREKAAAEGIHTYLAKPLTAQALVEATKKALAAVGNQSADHLRIAKSA